MKRISPLFLLSVVLFACNTHPAAVHYQLTEKSFYTIDSVKAAMTGGDERKAQQKFLQAIDIYKNGSDPARSVDIFKSAIYLQPSGKAYFELGSALLDDSRYEEALQALHIAEHLGYSPLANVMFKLSEAHAYLLKPGSDSAYQQDSLARYYMEVALQMGYVHPEEFAKGNAFNDVRGFYGLFNTTYNEALAGGLGHSKPDQILWETFKNQFRPIELPLTINTEWILAHQPEESIGYDYEKFIPEMRNAKFSREVEKEYYYCALVKKDTAYTALMYAGKNTFLKDANGNNLVFYLLTTYDRTGKIIDKMPVAGQSAFTDPFKVLTIQPNYTFEIRDYKNIYKDDPEKVGYDSNPVVRSEPQGSTAYRIAANGKFEKTGAPLAMR
jgi:hypothetical protein